jgi:hypothetical protein
VVISVWQPSATTWKAEFNILTKRPHEQLTSGIVDFDTASYPPELQPIDEAYMEAEAARQAEIDLSLELEKRATDVKRPELAYLPVKLERTRISPVTLWVRNTFPVKFADMASATKSPELARYLRVVMELQKLKAG